MASSLLALFDDIATLLDDVALMTKVATKKTAGVLGDDLALNAQQVSGVAAERELPVVWAVAKGSLLNKVALVPVAMGLSIFLPIAIVPLLTVGGLYLCFEGAEKIAHQWIDPAAEDHSEALRVASRDPSVDLRVVETEKIRGAIRTDFVLSAEIVIIALGTVQGASPGMQVLVLSALALLMTVGVYGLVAGIVKLDDTGVFLAKSEASWKRRLGAGILWAAPVLMKALSVLGTAAMFLVGGGIVAHAISPVHRWTEALGTVEGTLVNGAIGLVSGFLIVATVLGVRRMRTAR